MYIVYCQTKYQKLSDEIPRRSLKSIKKGCSVSAQEKKRRQDSAETERITVRVPAEKLEKLDEMVKKGEFRSKSDVVRAAIEKFIDAEDVPSNISKITVELPKGDSIRLEQLVDDGDSVSIDDAIRHAVREYVRVRLERALGEQQE
ncbi:MAG: ribbon-helix-helix protein, CopG family [Methanomassiliicoccales archaeon]|nr:MAG: ribbon-helix-helix protein, CopG family [Methanomassiliicoccales archaeon]